MSRCAGFNHRSSIAICEAPHDGFNRYGILPFIQLAELELPVFFRLGTKLCARRSVLLQWITSQENRALFRECTATMGSTQLETT